VRIAVIGPAPPLRGGISQHTAGMAEALSRHGCAVAVFSYARQYPNVLFPGTSQRDGGVSVGEEILDVLSPSTWRLTADRISAHDADRVVAQWWHPASAPAVSAVFSRVRGPARTLVCHNALPHEWFPAAGSALRRVASRTDEIICHSEYVAREIRALHVRTPLRVVPVPLLPRGLEPATGSIGEELLDERPRRILFFGHIRSYKGLEYLLDAWNGRDRGTPAVLSIVGEDYRRGAFGRLRASAEPVRDDVERQRRYVSDSGLLRSVARADALVLPYVRASQSGWLPIAAALGTPVVASDVGGLREQAAPGQEVRWVRPGDAAELIRALNEAIRRGPRSAAVRREALAQYACARRASWRRFCEVLGVS
jgi:glycosyltransferase involved in cell wall biosynthesis